MTPKKLHRLLAAALLALVPAAAVAADPWQVTVEAVSKIKAFKSTSRGVERSVCMKIASVAASPKVGGHGGSRSGAH